MVSRIPSNRPLFEMLTFLFQSSKHPTWNDLQINTCAVRWRNRTRLKNRKIVALLAFLDLDGAGSEFRLSASLNAAR